MKSCELCKSPAKIYCESDQASLCWTCDRKVHSANFLVARHSRTLLCRVCQSPTPWTATGEKLGPSAVSICEKCVVDANSDDDDDREESEGRNEDDDDEYDGDDDGETELDVEDEGENQVVPLAYTPPPAASSSSSDSYSIGRRGDSLKRKRVLNESDLSENDVECLSEQKHHRAVCAADSGDTSEGGNGLRLHRFMSLSSERMGDKLKIAGDRKKISGENDTGAVTGERKSTRTVGLDLNS